MLGAPTFHCATDRTNASCFAFGADGAKLVHLIRHGQGHHNVAAATHGAEAYRNQALKDARLDDVGEQQAHAVGTRIRDARMAVDVILVSPLTRALQTATLMFVDELKSRNPPRFVAIELCREAFGGHPCDQRRTRSELHRDFPHVDFSLVETDEDTWHNPEKRETVREVALRCDKMLDVLRARQERNIALVSHGVFLETLLNRCSLACVSEDVRSRRFDNAELRSIVIGGWSPVQTAHAGPQGGGGAAPRH